MSNVQQELKTLIAELDTQLQEAINNCFISIQSALFTITPEQANLIKILFKPVKGYAHNVTLVIKPRDLGSDYLNLVTGVSVTKDLGIIRKKFNEADPPYTVTQIRVYHSMFVTADNYPETRPAIYFIQKYVVDSLNNM